MRLPSLPAALANLQGSPRVYYIYDTKQVLSDADCRCESAERAGLGSLRTVRLGNVLFHADRHSCGVTCKAEESSTSLAPLHEVFQSSGAGD